MKVIDTDRGNNIYSVTFHADRKHLVGGGMEGIIRGWRVADGEEVDELMGADDWVFNIAVSRDGKWIASGTRSGQVQVWNAEDGDKLIAFNAHNHDHWVYAVDVSPDSTKIATSGSDGRTVCIWLLSTGERLLGPWKHKASVVGARFSPDGRLIATATWSSCHAQVYDAQDGSLLVDVPIKAAFSFNQSLAWSSDSEQLLVLSTDNDIHCLDASTGTTLSQWPIHGNTARCSSLANNGAVIAASVGSSVLFWDTTTHEQTGSVIQHAYDVGSMAISANCDIVVGGGNKITLCNLCDILPSSYVSAFASRFRSLISNHFVDGRSSHKESGKQGLMVRGQATAVSIILVA